LFFNYREFGTGQTVYFRDSLLSVVVIVVVLVVVLVVVVVVVVVAIPCHFKESPK
jgi:hypothetical protein